jgi:hypothetical protein
MLRTPTVRHASKSTSPEASSAGGGGGPAITVLANTVPANIVPRAWKPDRSADA